ncbi:MAG TPA: neutral/alkaline non-lysosomal ceramidase N-terminal domain-containing protein [Leadbetterella sp.]|nr:neutral/alkaline non-lysosomal ceramidase N-terminal domain-containing protein [Leadbetterella sp.]
MRKFLKVFGYFILVLAVLAFASIEKIDRTDIKETRHFKQWKELVKSLNVKETTGDFSVGWSKVNITPLVAGPMAGYGSRKGKAFDAVHDSVYVRVLALKNSQDTVYFLSADMLIIPPNVVEKLKSILQQQRISLRNIHFSATHTHNSLGGWGNSLTGRLFAGSYDPKVEIELATKFSLAIQKSKENLVQSKVFYNEVIDNEDIRNRLGVEDGKIDNEIRSLFFERQDGSKASLVTYGAHSTVLNSKTMQISRDYPGVLLDSLEKNKLDFGIYLAGAVGSMGPIEKGNDDFDEVKNQANGVLKHLNFKDSKELANTLTSAYIEIPMNHPSARISKNYALRPWVFKYLFGDYPTYIKMTKIGQTLVLGMPCDFSGEIMIELDAYAKSKGLDLMITSFDGSYIGYVTHDRLYDRGLYETSTMSWFGFQNGGYFAQIVKDLIDEVK